MTLDSPQPATFQPASKGVVKLRLMKWLVGLLVLGGLSGGGYLVYSQLATNSQQQARRQQQTVAVERVTLPVTISANGTIQPKQSTNVSPKSSGRLKTLLVDEGDSVQAGQILAYMDDSNLQGQLIQAQGQLQAAQANLEKVAIGNRPEDIAQAQARLKSAQTTLSQAQSDLGRYQQLYAEGAISAQSLSQYRTTRDTAQASVQEAQQALKLLQEGSRREDVNQARAQVTQAQGNLKTIQSQIEDMVIRAPFSGIVIKKFADPGDFVTPTTSGSDVSSASSSSILGLASTYQAVANVAEADISRIQQGQSVTIAADAYSNKSFKGTVAQIAAQATVTSNVTSFEVRVDLSDPQKLLRPGMNVDVQFDAGKLNDVVVIPTVAIVRQQNGSGVLVMGENGRPRFTPIETGVTVGNQTEVKSGLQGNEQILVSAPQPRSRQQSGSILPGFGGGGARGNMGGGPPGGGMGGRP